MSWATHAIEKLQGGEVVKIRPRGNSMQPRIRSGQLVTISPDTEELNKGDIVMCRVKGRDYLHLIKAVSSNGRYQIGNNRGGVNGWVGSGAIFGVATRIED
jgi:phage repressor protein C with HTH and peptisase S24 domain